ncbi:MAG: DNA recombination protein RmuC [Cyclobacteriaceae bacterium]|nr:MAG: DNA recombination protein RmuC [Cyclobacteriaceae bacterium]
MEWLFLFTGLLLGVLTGWVMGKLRYMAELSEKTSQVKAEQERNTALKQHIQTLEEKLEKERLRIEELSRSLSATEADYRNLEEKLSERQKELYELQEKFKTEFENLANKILEDKSKKFAEQNKTALSDLLTPLKEKISLFEKKVEETYDRELRDKVSLREEVRKLHELNHKLTEEASNLTRALKGDVKKQGDWGEFILETILERSGLMRDIEYRMQVVTKNAEGSAIKPDCLVMLPDNRHIIIDSKVSLSDYEQYVNADDDEQREYFLKAHLDSLKSHVKLLSDKNYYSSLDFNTPDFVLMFVPIEASFSVALQKDPDLFNFAWDKRIVIVGPTTLLATLRTVASIWKMQKQSQHALEIADESGKLYDKFVAFVEDLKKVGHQLNQTKDTYTDAMRKLYEGKGNLISKAEKIRELGAKTTKVLDPRLVERASED